MNSCQQNKKKNLKKIKFIQKKCPFRLHTAPALSRLFIFYQGVNLDVFEVVGLTFKSKLG